MAAAASRGWHDDVQRQWLGREGGSDVSVAPSVSYSITVRLEVPSRGRAVSELTHAVEQAGGAVTALDVTPSATSGCGSTSPARPGTPSTPRRSSRRWRRSTGSRSSKVSDRTFLLHLGGKIETARRRCRCATATTCRWSTRPGWPGSRMAIAAQPRGRAPAHHQAQQRRGGHRRVGGAGAGQHRPATRRCRSWRARPRCSSGSPASTPGRSAWTPRTPTRSSRTVQTIAPGFAGINLEDISAPRCFEVERRLRELLDIPVFHDDQHGTAIVVLAALTNALRVVGKKLGDVRIVMAGAGAAGTADTQAADRRGRHGRGGLRRPRARCTPAAGPGRQPALDRRAHQPAGYDRRPARVAARARTCSSGCPRRAS